MLPEEELADVLLKLEPPKIEGGSKARRDWIKVLIDVQMYLHFSGRAVGAYVDRVQGVTREIHESWYNRF